MAIYPPRCKKSITELTGKLGINDKDAYGLLVMYSVMTDLPTSDPIILDMILEDKMGDAYVDTY